MRGDAFDRKNDIFTTSSSFVFRMTSVFANSLLTSNIKTFALFISLFQRLFVSLHRHSNSFFQEVDDTVAWRGTGCDKLKTNDENQRGNNWKLAGEVHQNAAQ